MVHSSASLQLDCGVREGYSAQKERGTPTHGEETPRAVDPSGANTIAAIAASRVRPARTLTRARILLKADSGPAGADWTDEQIRHALDVGKGTGERVRRRYCERGLWCNF
jgi:hypothetical protein